jgi:hypothetical protein
VGGVAGAPLGGGVGAAGLAGSDGSTGGDSVTGGGLAAAAGVGLASATAGADGEASGSARPPRAPTKAIEARAQTITKPVAATIAGVRARAPGGSVAGGSR